MNLINKKAVKTYALQVSQDTRGGKFTRVSSDFLARIDAKLRNIVTQEIHSHPSVGVTLK